MITPIKTIGFFLIVGFILLLSVLALPVDGIQLVGFNIHMPSLKSFISKDTVSYADISELTSQIEDLDSLPDIEQLMAEAELNENGESQNMDTAKANASELAQNIHRLQFPNGDKTNLLKFLHKLQNMATSGETIRVMHYGDSQLEGDRITSFLRNKLQSKYGGSGPGLLPALQPYESYFSIGQSNEGAWKRYPVFGKVDPSVEHKKYGPLAAFSRFAPLIPDSLFTDSIQYQAAIIFNESKMAYSLVRTFQKLKIFYGNAKSKVEIKIFVDDQLIKTDILKVGNQMYVFKLNFPQPTKNLRLEFSGTDSPDFYGIALDGNTGVSMDNIGMRGSSGTIFNKIDYGLLKQSYDVLDVDLFIMQFGGNVMPYIKDTAQAVDYGRWFYSQLATLKKMRPESALIVIGPSDMSYKEGDKYLTYPYLPVVRDELRKATFKAGFAYWDMYEAMGGYNSMPSWVRSEPPLAGSDYTHFTPNGAKLIGNMFYNALMIEAIK